MLIENGTVFTGTEFENGLSIRLMNGIVQEVGESLRPEAGEKVIDLEGDYLLPGFVDVHIHAFRGSDTMRGETDIRRCMFLDDQPRNIETGHREGFFSVLVSDRYPRPDFADGYIDRVEDLLTIPELQTKG